jgi:hypothetical protein
LIPQGDCGCSTIVLQGQGGGVFAILWNLQARHSHHFPLRLSLNGMPIHSHFGGAIVIGSTLIMA